MGGWIAQDSGDYITAARLTIRAADHLRAAEPALRAMILMRRANIVVREDPELSVDLAASAAQLVEGQSVGGLAASITRQQALAAVANHDEAAFREHATLRPRPCRHRPRSRRSRHLRQQRLRRRRNRRRIPRHRPYRQSR